MPSFNGTGSHAETLQRFGLLLTCTTHFSHFSHFPLLPTLNTLLSTFFPFFPFPPNQQFLSMFKFFVLFAASCAVAHGVGGRHSRMADEMDHGSMGGMSMGCGNLAAAKPYVDANMLMHTNMAVPLTCMHTVDFVRAMIPHHKGAIAMCEVLVSEDAYLVELCVNITRVQRAEVAWMSQWLDARDHAVDAPCGLDANGNCPSDKDKTVLPFGGETPALPCENTLPTSSFCHTLDGGVNEAYCTCERAAADHACGSTAMVDGLAILDMDAECARFCGLCPSVGAPRGPLHGQVIPRGPLHGGYRRSFYTDVRSIWMVFMAFQRSCSHAHRACRRSAQLLPAKGRWEISHTGKGKSAERNELPH